ncbi:KEOPS complex component [Halorarum halophilum]|uniref:KEOPS complex component n=1 Tax=Halorarum halophilum TaxID=2743090 RepID=A0A7D5L2U8_9EURY|nr:KEOPS complex subunit Cgi121 [Halobaculum halophilum]QLG28283.1 KEOPS complex component [Halobaculum halophilum]
MRLVEGVAQVNDLDDFLADLDEVSRATGTTVQAFDAGYVVDRAHLERAVELADRAFDRGENVARDRGVEIMLYAAGRRQIDRALAMGVSEGEVPVVAVCVGDDEGAEADAAGGVRDLLEPGETLGNYDEELVREFFDVTDRELAATAGTLPDVVLERVALLDVEK